MSQHSYDGIWLIIIGVAAALWLYIGYHLRLARRIEAESQRKADSLRQQIHSELEKKYIERKKALAKRIEEIEGELRQAKSELEKDYLDKRVFEERRIIEIEADLDNKRNAAVKRFTEIEAEIRSEIEVERNLARRDIKKERIALRRDMKAEAVRYRANLEARETKISTETKFFSDLKSAFDKDFLTGRKWLADFVAEALRASDHALEDDLLHRRPPARAAASEVALAKKERREAVARIKFLEYQLASYKEYFPFLDEYEEVILAERIDFTSRGAEALDDADKVVLYVTDDEYSKLSPTDRNQLALDRYVQRHKANWEIGRIYERYVGHQYESEGWSVNYFGAIKGFEDMGRDLICRKGGDTHIVQAKCWSKDKTIHEKHIFQLFGTALLYEAENSLLPGFVKPVFVATTGLSEVAVLAAKRLGVEVRHMPLDVSYPMIKCNINTTTGEKIYHLPFDQQYDRVMVCNDGERYAHTVKEAEAAGFRRAFRYYGVAA